MGKLIKNHLARLICLTAASFQIWAALNAYFWPKVMFDWMTLGLNGLVKPVPILQTLNLVFGILGILLEAPLPWIAGTGVHKSIELRLLFYPAAALLAVLMYQATDPAGFYVVGMAVWFWAYAEGEVVCATPWTLPRKGGRGGAARA